MMTTSVNYVNIGLDPRQMAQPMQPNANERTAAEELKAEEKRQAESTTPEISIGKSPVQMFHIRQAADAGILRPVWLEMAEIQDMNSDMPRMRDLINRNVESKDARFERAVAEGSERAVAEGSERVVAEGSERAVAEGSERVVAEGSERAVAEGSERNESSPE